ncbi:anoctamin-4-like isoform X2 [Convolutriloba macropyga]|uniref:anoctamin-4-like isoform X2 n=1 Tax=Convolutriloba macropyga TaxID=536237 RepID=UPI003F51DDCE
MVINYGSCSQGTMEIGGTANDSEQRSKRLQYMTEPDQQGRFRKIDYVLVFKDLEDDEDKETMQQYRDKFIENLKKQNLEMEITGETTDTKYYKIHAPYWVLFKYADKNKMKMPLTWNDSEKEMGLIERLTSKVTLFKPPTFPEDDDEIEELAVKNPYNYFTAEFSLQYKDRFAIEELGEENFFTVADRNRVVRYILDNAVFKPCVEEVRDEEGEVTQKREEELMGITRMIANGSLTGAFPLHDGEYKMPEDIFSKHWINKLEELTERQKLYYSWASPKAWYKEQPMDPVRRYFGEKIAMYFSWLGYYTNMLLLASVLGLIAFIYGLATMGINKHADDLCVGPNANYTMCPKCDKPCTFWLLQDACTNVRLTHLFDNDLTVIYAILMALWSTMFLEFWKRKQNELQYEWDLFDFEDTQETLRPEFEEMAQKKKNWLKQNPVTKAEEPFMPLSFKLPRLVMSLSTVLFMILVVVAAIVGVIIYRVIILGILNQNWPDEASMVTSATAACLNLVAIMVFSFIYQILATKLTDLECPRTDLEYEDSYTLKMFLFQFVNYYSSIIYIAFFKGNFVGYPGNYNTILNSRQEECQPGGCLFELTFQLVIIMIGKQFINNVMEIGVPITMEFVRRKQAEREEKKRIAEHEAGATGSSPLVINEIDEPWEKDNVLTPQPKMNLFGEYLEMVIQFGFTTLFATAFPLAPVFAFVNNVIEVRLDAFKFVTALQRPWAQKSQDIGSWYAILEAVGILSVLFNAFIIAITSSYIDKYLYSAQEDNLEGTFWDFVYTTTNATENFAGYDCDDAMLETLGWTPDDCKPEVCYYKGYRYPESAGENAGQYTEQYWKALAARFIFVCVFEHLVFFIKAMVAYIVPDMPSDIKVQQLREQHVTRTYLYKEQDDDEESGLHDADAFVSMATSAPPVDLGHVEDSST